MATFTSMHEIVDEHDANDSLLHNSLLWHCVLQVSSAFGGELHVLGGCCTQMLRCIRHTASGAQRQLARQHQCCKAFHMFCCIC